MDPFAVWLLGFVTITFACVNFYIVKKRKITFLDAVCIFIIAGGWLVTVPASIVMTVIYCADYLLEKMCPKLPNDAS